MSFEYRKTLMAQALSIIAEKGVHGIEYNGAIELLGDGQSPRISTKARWSLQDAHRFTSQEFEDYMILAQKWGLVTRSDRTEWHPVSGVDKSSYNLDGGKIELTEAGWNFIEKNDQPILHRWGRNIVENAPSIVVAVATSWAVHQLGAPK